MERKIIVAKGAIDAPDIAIEISAALPMGGNIYQCVQRQDAKLIAEVLLGSLPSETLNQMIAYILKHHPKTHTAVMELLEKSSAV